LVGIGFGRAVAGVDAAVGIRLVGFRLTFARRRQRRALLERSGDDRRPFLRFLDHGAGDRVGRGGLCLGDGDRQRERHGDDGGGRGGADLVGAFHLLQLSRARW
jgi:hypothetical protein